MQEGCGSTVDEVRAAVRCERFIVFEGGGGLLRDQEGSGGGDDPGVVVEVDVGAVDEQGAGSGG